MDMQYLIIYLAAVNILAFLVYGWDKLKARHGGWRIPEKTLILLAVIGGSIGAAFGMIAFHHKTKKPKFYIGIPGIIIVQIAAISSLWVTR